MQITSIETSTAIINWECDCGGCNCDVIDTVQQEEIECMDCGRKWALEAPGAAISLNIKAKYIGTEGADNTAGHNSLT